MNHTCLRARNVWTRELDGLRWESFSHERWCFELQRRFDFVSSIANLQSRCPPARPPLRITLSHPRALG